MQLCTDLLALGLVDKVGEQSNKLEILVCQFARLEELQIKIHRVVKKPS